MLDLPDSWQSRPATGVETIDQSENVSLPRFENLIIGRSDLKDSIMKSLFQMKDETERQWG